MDSFNQDFIKQLKASMIWTAWKNGKNSYGFKVFITDRDAYFDRNWQAVDIELPINKEVLLIRCNINKDSFWKAEKPCLELINKDIGYWFGSQQLYPWPKGKPPKFNAVKVGVRRFEVSLITR